MHLTFDTIPKGYTFRFPENTMKATEKIVSDGRVDDAFIGQSDNDEAFISDLTDARISSFLKDESSPGEGWVAHPLGGFDRKNQSLFVEDGRVVLRTKIEENGTEIQHRIESSLSDSQDGPQLQDITEGYTIIDAEWKKQVDEANASGAILIPPALQATNVAYFYEDWLTPNV